MSTTPQTRDEPDAFCSNCGLRSDLAYHACSDPDRTPHSYEWSISTYARRCMAQDVNGVFCGAVEGCDDNEPCSAFGFSRSTP